MEVVVMVRSMTGNGGERVYVESVVVEMLSGGGDR